MMPETTVQGDGHTGAHRHSRLADDLRKILTWADDPPIAKQDRIHIEDAADKLDEAIALLERFVKEKPFCVDPYAASKFCHYCTGGDQHEPDCPYVAARAFLDSVEPAGG